MCQQGFLRYPWVMSFSHFDIYRLKFSGDNGISEQAILQNTQQSLSHLQINVESETDKKTAFE